MTNDGDFGKRYDASVHAYSKTYRVTVRPSITEDQIHRDDCRYDD